jgi:hypothetical protein
MTGLVRGRHSPLRCRGTIAVQSGLALMVRTVSNQSTTHRRWFGGRRLEGLPMNAELVRHGSRHPIQPGLSASPGGPRVRRTGRDGCCRRKHVEAEFSGRINELGVTFTVLCWLILYDDAYCWCHTHRHQPQTQRTRPGLSEHRGAGRHCHWSGD